MALSNGREVLSVVKKGLIKFIKNDLASISVIFIILLAVVIFKSQQARLGYSLVSISKDIAIFTVVGMAQMATLAVGQFNLAVGAMGGAAGMVCGYMINIPNAGMMDVEQYAQAEIGLALPWIIGVAAALVVGFLIGVLQGGIIVKTKINPFIITLAMINVLHGINMAITENIYFRNLPMGLKDISTVTVPASSTPVAGETGTYGLPIIFIVVLVVMGIMWLLYNRTVLGRKMLATGVSTRAADFAGISSSKYITIAHGISGALCGLAGVLTASKLGAAQTSIGDQWLLYSFAAAILGGTLLNGGKVSIVGTMIGAGIMTIMTTVLALLKLDAFTHQIFIGGVLLLAFVLNKGRENLSKKQDRSLIEAQEALVQSGGDENA